MWGLWYGVGDHLTSVDACAEITTSPTPRDACAGSLGAAAHCGASAASAGWVADPCAGWLVFSMARARNLSGLCENSTGHGERLPAHDAATIDVNGIQGAFALPIA